MTRPSFAPTQVMVLGVSHLTRGFDERLLADAREALLAWKPDAVAIEVVPGEQVFWQRAADPCWEEEQSYLASTSLPLKAAAAVADLHDWSFGQARQIARDSGASRRDRALAHFACYEPYTACLLAGENPPAELVPAVDAITRNRSESWLVGGWLATQLGLEKLWQIDDFSDPDPTSEQWERIRDFFFAAMREDIECFEKQIASATTASGLWDLWKSFNTEEGYRVAELRESLSWLREADESDHLIGRLRLSQWRARNLRMAANVRTVTGNYPGGRVLVIVGAAHAGPMKAALAHDQYDLELVDPNSLPTEEPRV